MSAARAVDADLSGLRVRFAAVPDAIASAFEEHWAGYLVPPADDPDLLIRVEDAPRAMSASRFMSASLHIDADGGSVRFRRDEGEMVHDLPSATATARLAQGDPGRRFWGLVNLTMAAVGWRLLGRGGGALHAAGALIDGRAFLLVGPSGCGKTTWARTAADAGLPVLSDDCVLVDGAAGRLETLGSPFRSKELPSPGRGRWPVAAILIPKRAAAPALEPASRLQVEARVSANLLFAAPAWDATHDAATAATAIATGAPARVLAFRPDASWVPLVAGL